MMQGPVSGACCSVSSDGGVEVTSRVLCIGGRYINDGTDLDAVKQKEKKNWLGFRCPRCVAVFLVMML